MHLGACPPRHSLPVGIDRRRPTCQVITGRGHALTCMSPLSRSRPCAACC
jgi:hypothetical protein